MKIAKVNGTDFERMLKAGLKNIRQHEIEVNDMNVFPVPDGDTGTNIRMTLQNGISNSPSNENLGLYLNDIKKGMLLGARGNSGVILSQLFTGIADSLKTVDSADVELISQALTSAYKTAYKSVIKPVEGTVLTVSREGAEKIAEQISSINSIDELLECYLGQMNESLLKTPDLLPVLKESGVLDSGAKGYIYVIKGMLNGLLGIDVDSTVDAELNELKKIDPVFDTEKFNRDSKFEDGYCTEFILQLLSDSKYDQKFSIDDFIEKLNPLGNSLVAFQSDDRVKVHIHTLKPYLVIELAQRYGEFVTFKMENMQIQHNEHDFAIQKKNKAEHKKQAIIAVVNGEGLRELYEGFGCDIILDGGATMNTSSQEFVDAFETVDADKIIILPNNKNIFFAAKQAIEISGKTNIEILETENPVEGYYALAMGQVGSDIENQIDYMKSGMQDVDVISIAVATKPYSQDNIKCEKDDFISMYKGKLVASGKNLNQVVEDSLKVIPDFDSKVGCMIVSGKNASEEMSQSLVELIENLMPDMEINVVEGGQEVLHFMIGF